MKVNIEVCDALVLHFSDESRLRRGSLISISSPRSRSGSFVGQDVSADDDYCCNFVDPNHIPRISSETTLPLQPFNQFVELSDYISVPGRRSEFDFDGLVTSIQINKSELTKNMIASGFSRPGLAAKFKFDKKLPPITKSFSNFFVKNNLHENVQIKASIEVRRLIHDVMY